MKMFRQKTLMFFNADTATGGAAVIDAPAVVDVPAPNPFQTAPPAEPGGAVKTPVTTPDIKQPDPNPPVDPKPVEPGAVVAPVAPAPMTPESVAIAVREALAAGTQQQQQPAAQPQLTQDQVNQMMNAYVPTEELMGRILSGGEDGVKAFHEAIQGVIKQATTMSWLQTQLVQRQMEERYKGVETYVNTAQQEKALDGYFKANPDLKVHTPTLQVVKESLEAKGAFKGLNQQQAFDLITKTTRELLKSQGVNTGAAPAAGGTPTGGAAPAAPTKMANLSGGAQHGAGGGPAAASAPTAETAKRLFGPK